MSNITGEFTFQIENFEKQNANFIFYKNTGIIYINNCNFFPPNEKENLNWIPYNYCFKLVKNSEYLDTATNTYKKYDIKNISTVPVFPIPTTFEEIIPNFKYVNEDEKNQSTYQTWVYYNKYTIPNSIKYIKIYLEKQENDNNITNKYKFYTINNNDDYIPFSYTVPHTFVNKLEICIQKKDDTIIYNGTWTDMTTIFNNININNIMRDDYNYKLKLNNYNIILNNIDSIETLLNNTTEYLNNILQNLAMLTTSNCIPNSTEDTSENGTEDNDSNPLLLNETNVTDNLLNNIENLIITPIKNIISNSVLLYEPNDYIELIKSINTNINDNDILTIDNKGNIIINSDNNNNEYNIKYNTYIIAPTSCNNIIGTEYLTYNINYINLNLPIIEKFKQNANYNCDTNSTYDIKNKTIIKLSGSHNNSDIYSSTGEIIINLDSFTEISQIDSFEYIKYIPSNNSDIFDINNLNENMLSTITNIKSTNNNVILAQLPDKIIIWGSTTLNNIYKINSSQSVNICNTNTNKYFIITNDHFDESDIINNANIITNDDGFAIWTTNTIITWIYTNSENSSITFPDSLDSNCIVKSIHATKNTFAALLEDDSDNTHIITWGHLTYNQTGTNLIVDLSSHVNLTDIKEIYSTDNAYLAVRDNNTFITWGNPDFGAIDTSNIHTYANESDNSASFTTIISISNSFLFLYSTDSTDSTETNYLIITLLNITEISLRINNINNIDNTETIIWPVIINDDTDSFKYSRISFNINEDINIITNDDGFAIWTTDTIITWNNTNDENYSITFPDSTESDESNYIIKSVHATKNTFAALLEDNIANTHIITWGDLTYHQTETNLIVNLSSDDNLTNIKEIYSTDNAYLAVRDDNTFITWGNPDFGAISTTDSSNDDNKNIYSSSTFFIINYKKIILDITADFNTSNGTVNLTITSNIDSVNIEYICTPDHVELESINSTPLVLTIPIYVTSIENLITYTCSSQLQICKYITALNLFYKKFLNFRKCYIQKLLHMEIYILNNYTTRFGLWYPDCNHSCLENDYNSSMKEIRYNSNITLINTMTSNIMKINHIGNLQHYLIDKLCDILIEYKNQSDSISSTDCDYDNTYLFFNEFIDDIINEINTINKLIIFDNSFIFSEFNTENKLIFNFNSNDKMYNKAYNSNKIDFILPELDSNSLTLNNIYSDESDIDLYISSSNLSQISQIYSNSLNILKSKKTAFTSLDYIIKSKINLIMDYVEYNKNILD